MHNGRRRNNEVAKDFKGAIKNLIIYNKPLVKYFIIALILSFVASVIAIIGPDKLKDITNIVSSGIMTGIDLNKVKEIAIVLVILYAISAIFGYIEGLIMTVVNNRFQRNIRNDRLRHSY